MTADDTTADTSHTPLWDALADEWALPADVLTELVRFGAVTAPEDIPALVETEFADIWEQWTPTTVDTNPAEPDEVESEDQ